MEDLEDQDWYNWDRVVVVENLPGDMSEGMLEVMFSQIGELLGVRLGGDSSAEVEFRWAADAEKAVRGFDGVELAGVAMECQVECGFEEEELRSDY